MAKTGIDPSGKTEDIVTMSAKKLYAESDVNHRQQCAGSYNIPLPFATETIA